MGWLDQFFTGLALMSPEGRARLNYNLGARRQMLAEDESYRQQQREAQLLPLQVEHAQLQNQSIRSLLDDAMRERAEKAQAPGAAQAVVSAFMPRAAEPGRLLEPFQGDEDDEGRAFLPRTMGAPARGAARTVGDLFDRGVTPGQFDIAERFRPATVRGLGLMTPEAASKAADEEGLRRRMQELQREAEGLDLSTPDARDRAYQLAARAAAVKGDYKGLIAAATRSEDIESVIAKIREAFGGGEGLPGRLELSTKVGDTTIGIKPDTPAKSALVDVQRARMIAEAKLDPRKPQPGTPEFDVELGMRMERIMPLTEGGGFVRPSTGQVNQPPILKPAGEGERKDIAQLNALIPLGEGLIADWKKNPAVKPGPLARLGEREIGLGIRPSDLIGATQTPDQRRFMARASRLISAFRRVESGLQVTNSEALRTMPSIPDDPGAVTLEQVEELTNWAKSNREEIDRALIGANRLPGPAPQAPAPRGTPDAPPADEPEISEGQKILREAIDLAQQRHGNAFGNLTKDQQDAIMRAIRDRRLGR